MTSTVKGTQKLAGQKKTEQPLKQSHLEMTSTNYSVKVVNNGAAAWQFYVYQKPPAVANNLSLAWFASPYHIGVGDSITFSWNIQYSFVWSATGIVKPGIQFTASGSKECDPEGENVTSFTFNNSTPDLSNPTTGGTDGSLTIKDGDSVPSNTFAVGVGMSGKGTYVVNAGPNLTHEFTPEPKYYIVAADEVVEGQVMDITTVTKSGSLVFPPNVYDLTATLKADNQWDIKPAN